MSLESPANRCFVCGPGNPDGLQVRFRLEGDVCRAEFVPARNHGGYDGVTHGGILFSLLDDVMANWVFLQGEQCFTARAEVRYRRALPIARPSASKAACACARGGWPSWTGSCCARTTGPWWPRRRAAS